MLISIQTRARLFSIAYSLIALLIPGASLLLAGRYKLGLSIPFIGLFWVTALSWSRIVIKPEGFIALLFGLLALHLVSYTVGVILSIRRASALPWLKTLGVFVLLCTLNLGITFSSHFYKDQWFGFAFYHIPSESMSPTLQTGDVALIDTWVYKNQPALSDDIIIAKRTGTSMVLAKRLQKTRNHNEDIELFIVGDNPNNSIDSRRFGWVSDDYLIGKVQFVWFSFNDAQRYLISAK
jgi:signal peptidase I